MKLAKKAQWRVEYGLYRFIEWTLGLFPPADVYRAGSSLGGLLWHLLPRRRLAVRKNLRVAFANEKTPDEQAALAREVFRSTAANMLSAVRTARIDSESLREFVTISNPGLLEASVAKGRGTIILVPHMGNWEVLAQMKFLLPEGTRGGTHYRPLNNPYLNELITRRRQRQGTKLFSKRSSPHTLASFLREGNVLGILADQRVNKSGYFVPYYGRFTACSPLPEMLASRTGAGILALSLRTVQPGRWEATFHPVKSPDTPHCMQAMEDATRVSPEDVFWFQERWRLHALTPYLSRVKAHPMADPVTSAKPYQVAYQSERPSLPPDARPDLEFVQAPAAIFDPALAAEQLEPVLRDFSNEGALPLDAIHHPHPSSALHRACKRLGIQLITAPLS